MSDARGTHAIVGVTVNQLFWKLVPGNEQVNEQR
jgi:hypothetical protein